MTNADDIQRKKIEDLDFELLEQSNGLIATQKVFDAILKAKDNQMKNGDLYETYAKLQKLKVRLPMNYTRFINARRSVAKTT